jgi:N-acetylglucosamine repressor
VVSSKPDLLRKLNDRQILNLIRQKGPISRAEIARELGLALPTVSRVVDSFLERGWIETVGAGNSSGGRPPTLLQLKDNGTGAIGIEVGRSSVRIIYTDLRAHVRFRDERPINEIAGPAVLLKYVRDFIEQHHLSFDRIEGIGIAAPGPLDAVEGVLLAPEDIPNEWIGAPVVQVLKDGLNVPCYLSNDANAAALAESWFGKATDYDSVVFVLSDVGLGAGVVINGSIWNGKHNFSGEISHMIVDIQGLRCSCGRVGCLNAYASLRAIEQAVRGRESGRADANWADIIRHAKEGINPEAEVIQTAARYLAAAIVNVIQIIDPAVVVLGGRAMLHEDMYLFNLVRQHVNDLLGSEGRDILLTDFGLDAVCVGAASLALQYVYDHTRLLKQS